MEEGGTGQGGENSQKGEISARKEDGKSMSRSDYVKDDKTEQRSGKTRSRVEVVEKNGQGLCGH